MKLVVEQARRGMSGEVALAESFQPLTGRRGQVKYRFQLLLEGLTACRAIAGLENETSGDHPGNAVVKTLTVGLDP